MIWVLIYTMLTVDYGQVKVSSEAISMHGSMTECFEAKDKVISEHSELVQSPQLTCLRIE